MRMRHFTCKPALATVVSTVHHSLLPVLLTVQHQPQNATSPPNTPTNFHKMTSKVTPVTSSAHFRTLTSSATFTVVDFYADWCGPCKVISPIFEQLATAESKPGKIIFCKVDVDAQREIAGNYGVSAYVSNTLPALSACT
jgi:thioredoxin-like negative regulator of GroEL